MLDMKPLIKPKTVSDMYEGQHYTCAFDVHAEPDRRWFWVVHYTVTTDIVGASPTLKGATREARRNIRELKKRVG
jgi:hypothetical protein